MTVAVRSPAAEKKAQTPDRGRTARLVRPPRASIALARQARRACGPLPRWLSEIMLQQTTVKAVGPYYARFLSRWPTVDTLAAASLDDVLRAWAGLGYYARARNLYACAKAVVERHGGSFPDNVEALRVLPGIGDYTAAAVAAIAFDCPAVPVDGNVERVVSRLFAVEDDCRRQSRRSNSLPLLCCPGADAPAISPRLSWTSAPPSARRSVRHAFFALGKCVRCVCTRRSGNVSAQTTKSEGELRRGAAFVALRADGSRVAADASGERPARVDDGSTREANGRTTLTKIVPVARRRDWKPKHDGTNCPVRCGTHSLIFRSN